MTAEDRTAYILKIRRSKGEIVGTLYRRHLDNQDEEKITRLAGISPRALLSGYPLLRVAVQDSQKQELLLEAGKCYELETDWGVRVACYALVASGLRDDDRLRQAAANLQYCDGAEAAWWLGLMTRPNGLRAVRALRILVEAVK